jgi:hypothetical protein
MEVVQRLGYDSFTPDNGVLIVKNKDQQNNSCGFGCHAWVIDAHPEDMNMVDFVKPNGQKVMRTVADYRQLNDALFHAGLRSGSQFEWEDTPNRLHFYVIDRKVAANGVLSYIVAVRSLDGAGPQTHGVNVKEGGAASSAPAGFHAVNFSVSNTGKAAVVPTGSHPAIVASAFGSDVYHVSARVEGAGQLGDVANSLIAVPYGSSAEVSVYLRNAPGTATVTLTVVSEGDPSVKGSAIAAVRTPEPRPR